MLVFGSGFCALVYQIVWMRELRLVFGASTPATAATLAVFMAGLGLGSLFLGPRADASRRPLLFYAGLEAIVAILAAVSPLWVAVARGAYAALGGLVSLGSVGATVVRLLLATLVLLAPATVMGGTLPAAARAVEAPEDSSRHRLAFLYGMNTLGAVVGATWSTFIFLEALGVRNTLWCAVLVNMLVAVSARAVDRRLDAPRLVSVTGSESRAAAPFWLVIVGAATAGFAFFFMELVWYRMLSPLLGGSVFTFGLILAVALLGIGLGGAAYAVLRPRGRATLGGLALTCLVEAGFLAVPLVLGDRLAVVAMLLRDLASLGFGGLVAGWLVVTGVVVLPAAFVSGVQFPVLIALLGEGSNDVGRHTGWTYAANTLGAITGALAGGFGLMVALGAVGSWRAVVLLLVAYGLVALAVAVRRDGPSRGAVGAVAVALVAVTLCGASGPTAFWRHQPIGAGRANHFQATRNELVDWQRESRRVVLWEEDGRESTVALSDARGLAFVVNGKVDGSMRSDADTQLMLGMLGALLHDEPRFGLVIGLGTGTTAGWLARLPAIERIDVVELEPAILDVARACAPANGAPLDNPKVNVILTDAREVLQTTPERYDLVLSEPSNPYRAGVASLFTREFYEAVRTRLKPDGLFLQWVQAYEIDGQTLETLYVTLAAEFGAVETWQVGSFDLVLVASPRPIRHSVAGMRARLATPIVAEATQIAWGTHEVEGVWAHFLAGDGVARALGGSDTADANTDDRTIVEYAFARSLGHRRGQLLADLSAFAASHHATRPEGLEGELDWSRAVEGRAMFAALANHTIPGTVGVDQQAAFRVEALRAFSRGDMPRALSLWRSQPREPTERLELWVVSGALAAAGDERALPYIDSLKALEPAEAQALLALLRVRQKSADAGAALAETFRLFREDPWPAPLMMERTLELCRTFVDNDPGQARLLFGALAEPFALHNANEERLKTRLHLAEKIPDRDACAQAYTAFEPHTLWTGEFLKGRLRCYTEAGDDRAALAAEELDDFQANEAASLGARLAPPSE